MSENRCICCNAIIPEGYQVCWACSTGTFAKSTALFPYRQLWIFRCRICGRRVRKHQRYCKYCGREQLWHD